MTKFRPSKRRNKNSNQVIKKVALLSIGGIVMAGVVTALCLYEPDIALGKDFCSPSEPVHRSAIWIDNSLQGLSPTQLRDYRIALDRAYEASPANSKILIFSTASDQSNSLADPTYIQCKPPATLEGYKNAGLSEKPAPYIKRQMVEAEKAYQKQVEIILSDVQNVKKAATQSPILEQIRAVSHSSEFQGSSKSLKIMTDGIQNSRSTKMFCLDKSAMPPFKIFKNRSDYELAFKPKSFAGTDVSILLVEQFQLPIQEMPYCTTNEIRHFWLNYFKSNGAKTVTLTPLQN